MTTRYSILGVALALALAATPAGAQSLIHSHQPAGGMSSPTDYDLSSVAITQSLSPVIWAQNSVSCGNPAGTTDNHFIRRFFLDTDHDLHGPFDVYQVDFGIEEIYSPVGAMYVQVRLFKIPKALPLTFANMSYLGQVTVPIPAGTHTTVVAASVFGSIERPEDDDLVVDVFSPDGRAYGEFFFIGSNGTGQTRPSYLASQACALNEPTDLAVLGLEYMHVFMNVIGLERPTATRAATWGRVKTLYR